METDKYFQEYNPRHVEMQPRIEHGQKKNKNEHDNNGELRCPNRHVLSKPVVPHMRLHYMSDVELDWELMQRYPLQEVIRRQTVAFGNFQKY